MYTHILHMCVCVCGKGKEREEEKEGGGECLHQGEFALDGTGPPSQAHLQTPLWYRHIIPVKGHYSRLDEVTSEP